MRSADIAVVLAGLTAIGWVNWYFFVAGRASINALATAAGQRAEIRVVGGYDPAVVHARLNVPLTLVFDRQENSSCSEEVVIGAFGIRRFLPAYEKTEIEFTPDRAGTFDITCGMSMLHGSLVVEGA